jgi:hypothetical protein
MRYEIDSSAFGQILLQILMHLVRSFFYAACAFYSDNHNLAAKGISKHVQHGMPVMELQRRKKRYRSGG